MSYVSFDDGSFLMFLSLFLWLSRRGPGWPKEFGFNSTEIPLIVFVLDTDSPGTGQDVCFSQSARIMC